MVGTGKINLGLFGANDGRFSKLVARFSDLSKLIRVMAYIMRVALANRRLGGISAEGRTKLAKEITAGEAGKEVGAKEDQGEAVHV